MADLAAAAADGLGLPAGAVTLLRRAGLVHDLGQVGVPNGIWDRPGRSGWRSGNKSGVTCTSPRPPWPAARGLAVIGRIGGAHNERLDGSGYRGSRDQGAAERILAAADTVDP